MRSHFWLLPGMVLIACGGSAFSGSGADPNGGNAGSGDTGDGASAGELSRGGRGAGGSVVSHGGKVGTAGNGNVSGSASGGSSSSGGVVGVAGDLGIAGDLVAGGSVSVAGEPGVSGSAGSGMTGPDTACPTTQPDNGGSCTDGLTCSYGDDVRTSCRPTAACQQGSWASAMSACKAIKSCAGDATPAATCDPDTSPACVREGSQYCECALCAGNKCGAKPIWRCSASSGDSDCPKLAPNEGAACSGALKCQYGSCAFPNPNNITANCDGGAWAWKGLVCPL